jgi:hypothetical protein
MQSKSGGSSHASSQLTLERDGTNYLQFMTANNGTSGLLFGDVADNDGTAIKYDHNTSLMLFNTEASERLRIGSAGQIGLSGANYGTSGQVMTSQGGSAAPQWASVSAVQVSDGWWNGSDVSNNYWQHSNVWGSSFGSLPTRRSGFPSVSGQQMSIDGGGSWQFPSAGLWKVEWHLQLSSGANNTSDFYLIESTDGASSWSSGDAISGWNTHFCGNYSSDKSVATLHATVNFTNVSNYYLQCKLSTNGNAIVRKGTMILFTKLN